MSEGSAPVTGLSILLTVLISWRAFVRPELRERLLFDSRAVLGQRQLLRLLSAAFVHANWLHLLLNMYGLYAFGTGIEERYGPGPLLLIYFASIIGGNLLSLLFHRHERHRALGASGGVSGIIFAAIFLFPGGKILLFFPPIALPAWLFALLFVLGSIYGMRARRDNIGHDAHLGGALVGLVVTALLFPRILSESLALFLAVLGLGVVLLLFLLQGPALPRLHWDRPGSVRRGRSSGPERGRRERGRAVFPSRKRRISLREPADIESLEPHLRRRRLNELLDRISEVGLEGLSESEREELNALSSRKEREDRERTRPH